MGGRANSGTFEINIRIYTKSSVQRINYYIILMLNLLIRQFFIKKIVKKRHKRVDLHYSFSAHLPEFLSQNARIF